MASSTPFVGEISIAGFNFAPVGWAQCNGQLLPISQNTALFSILGTTYGGDGRSNFGLPNMQGVSPLGAGQGPALSLYNLGDTGGTSTVQLTLPQVPVHTHGLGAVIRTGTTPNTADAVGSLPATSPTTDFLYSTTASPTDFMAPLNVNLDPQAGMIGGGQPHNNMQPYIVMNFIVAMQGIFPPRS